MTRNNSLLESIGPAVVLILGLMLYAAVGRFTYNYLGAARADAQVEAAYQLCKAQHSNEYSFLCHREYRDNSTYVAGGVVWPISLPVAVAVRNYTTIIAGTGVALVLGLVGVGARTGSKKIVRVVRNKLEQRRDQVETALQSAHAALLREDPKLARELEEV